MSTTTESSDVEIPVDQACITSQRPDCPRQHEVDQHSRHELPTPWGPARKSDKRRCHGLALRIPDDVWARRIADPVHGYPTYYLELSWVAEDTVHFATVAGFRIGEETTETNREVVDHRWVELRSVAIVTLDLSANSGTVTLINGDVRDDWPVLLINQHYH